MNPNAVHYESIKENPIVSLASGQSVTVRFRIRNDSGYGARYSLNCSELPQAWWSCEPVSIAENGDDILELVISLPPGVPASEYAAIVRALWDGRPDTRQTFPLKIVITPGVASQAVSEPRAPEPVVPTLAAAQPVASPPPAPEPAPVPPTEPPPVRSAKKPVPAPPVPPAFRIAVYEKGNLLQVYPFKPTGTVIGRDPGSDLCLNAAIVSRSHAALHLDGSRLLLQDTSSGGTFRNGMRVPNAGEVEVEPGDVIDIRPYTLTLIREGQTPPASLTSGIPTEAADVTVSAPPVTPRREPPKPAPEPLRSPIADPPEPATGVFAAGNVDHIEAPLSEAEAAANPSPIQTPDDEVFGSERHEKAPLKFEEEVVYDPKDNDVISVFPGTTVILCYRFDNPPGSADDSIFYIERHSRLKADDELNRWVMFPRERVDISPGQAGEVYAKITVPETAAPSVQTLRFVLGLQGKTPRDQRIRIHVREVPAVSLTAQKERLATGPFFLRQRAQFDLNVAQQGNSGTAFRLLLYPPDNSSAPLLATAQEGGWDVQAHSELGELRMPGFGVRAEPVNTQVAIGRKGVWWWGFKEERAVLVRAVPVTDARNAGRGNNEQKITFVRSRLLPFPYSFLWLLCLVLIPILGGTPHSVGVTQAVAQSEADNPTTFYVVNKPDAESRLKATLTWIAPFYVSAKPVAQISSGDKMTLNDDTLTASYPPPSKPTRRVKEVKVQNPLGGGETTRVFFLNCRTDTPLQITDDTAPKRDGIGLSAAEPDGEGQVAYTLTVPKTGYARVTFKNQHPSDEIIYELVKQTVTDRKYSVPTGTLEGSSLNPGGSKTIKIGNPAGVNDSAEIVLVTSDVNHRKITISVQPEP